ncbi:MAG: prepilin-type N-terminal cleavage/methylation domain-containing protein [Methyloprofundus sp.]|nr:prepilin-type N-terminal cleavage/methylation domain-containing protein [Methyloprofundus sp.]
MMINTKQVAGFTLIELMLVVAIAGLLASVAVPSFSKLLERNKLKEAVEGLKSDMMWMRTETVKRSCNLRVTFDKDAWSYTIFRAAGECDCPSGGGDCNNKVVTGSQYAGVSMSSAAFSGGTSTFFDFRRGTAGIAGNAQLDTSNYHVRVLIARVGRVRICNVSDETGLAGYEEC